MDEGVYAIVSGASAAAFFAIGAGLVVEPGGERARKAFGALFLALGAAYALSRLSASYRLPLAADNFAVIAIVFAVSQALFEISLYLFGGEAVRGSRRSVYLVGLAWSATLWLLPALDVVLGLGPIGSSVEDGRAMGPFQAFVSAALYAWPLAISALSFRSGRWRLADFPRELGAAWAFLGAFAGVIAALAAIGVSMAASFGAGYRAGHVALQAMMLGWYLFYRSKPGAFARARDEIGRRHEQRSALSSAERAAIEARLARAVAVDAVYAAAGLSLGALAKRLKVPEYKLSAYFNAVLGLSFPAWLNARRVDRARELLMAEPDRGILELSLEAGFTSKTVFNAQFKRLVGMSPSEYRERGGS